MMCLMKMPLFVYDSASLRRFVAIKFVAIAALFLFFSDVNAAGKSNEKYLKVSALNGEQKKMYALMKECIMLKAKDSLNIHLFSSCMMEEDETQIVITTWIYDRPVYTNCSFSGKGATSSAILRIKKWKEEPEIVSGVTNNPRGGGGTGNGSGTGGYATADPEVEKVVRYYLVVRTESISESRSKGIVLSKQLEKPYFKEKYDEISFALISSQHRLDSAYYRRFIGKVEYVDKEVAIVRRDTLVGVVDPDGKVLIPFEYQSLSATKAGFLARKDKKVFFIDLSNKLISDKYDKVEYTHRCDYPDIKNYLKVKKDGRYNFVDSLFRPMLPPVYSDLKFLYMRPTILIGKKEEGKVLISCSSWEPIGKTYEDIVKVDDSLLFVTENGKTGIIDKNGVVYAEMIYDSIGLEISNYPILLYVMKKDGRYALYKNAKFLTDFKYDTFRRLGSYYIVSVDGKFGLITAEGRELTALKYDSISADKKLKAYTGVIQGKSEAIALPVR
jgi:WG containing repeat